MMVKNILSKSVIVVLFLAFISSCGFHLRGTYSLPAAMQTTYIVSSQANSGLVRRLKRSLKASNITISALPTDAAATLTLSQETRKKRIVSVDSNGRAREYALTYAVTFEVTKPADDFNIEPRTVRISRDFIFDSQAVLGNQREESQLYDDMQQDLVRLILQRLQSQQAKIN